jgi:hypothetical protein
MLVNSDPVGGRHDLVERALSLIRYSKGDPAVVGQVNKVIAQMTPAQVEEFRRRNRQEFLE